VSTQPQRVPISVERPWFAPDGTPLIAREAQLEVRSGRRWITEVRLLFEVSPETWHAVVEGQWFHLEPEAWGPVFAGDFDAGSDIRIEARLAPGHLHLFDASAGPKAHAAVLLQAADDNPVRQTESWYALFVTQESGPARTGFQTRWTGETGGRLKDIDPAN